MKRALKELYLILLVALLPFCAMAQSDVDQEATVTKMNAFVSFLNRAIRASDSLDRYDSWVDMKKGPTGKEKVIYGLYAPYDVRNEIQAAIEAAAGEPKLHDLDAAILRFAAVYEDIAPILEKASKYYDRSDYKSDKMKEGKVLHSQIAELAPEFVTARKEADRILSIEKRRIDLLQLAALEKAEGKKSRWHVRNVMINAEAIVDILPSAERMAVDMSTFNDNLDNYAKAVREFDDYATKHPNSFHVFESAPGSLLSKLREFHEVLEKNKGNASKGTDDLQWIIQEYNMMVTTSETATMFSSD
ncbi:DUF3829 domain-containing protein [Agrobacterium fabrum]|uniref:DUF3829 domain-containing protein n=1 Tax=Agrobacterium fabrum TaxID=1176649 RepID=UPI003BA0C103